MNIFICGQKSFGKAVLIALHKQGHNITGIAPAPQKIKKDKMVGYALLHNIPIVSDCERLEAKDIPAGTELVVCAHSHYLVSEKILANCKYGGIGFHPSLLPRHRGQDAVRWAVAMGDAITGGTIYKLSDKCDGGDILLRRIVFIHKDWDYHKLWEVLFPIGVEMVIEAVEKIESGSCVWEKQDEECATFEPSWDRPRLRRNDLIQIGGSVG